MNEDLVTSEGLGIKASRCLNCDTSVRGSYCHSCGQHIRENLDRSLSRLLGEFLGTMFFLDNRFFLSLRYLFLYPGKMTVEFLEGKRKKFISPVTLFLFFNLIYFFVNPLSDYSLSLYDQMYAQPYSDWPKALVEKKLLAEGIDEQTYSITYQLTSDNVSKSIMIVNVPLIACLVFLMAFRRRRFYFDSLIYSFHFFSVFLFSWVLLDWVGHLLQFIFGARAAIPSEISFALFTLIIPLTYAVMSIKRFLATRWGWSMLAGLGVFVAVFVANLVYRLIIFLVTFWLT